MLCCLNRSSFSNFASVATTLAQAAVWVGIVAVMCWSAVR